MPKKYETFYRLAKWAYLNVAQIFPVFTDKAQSFVFVQGINRLFFVHVVNLLVITMLQICSFKIYFVVFSAFLC